VNPKGVRQRSIILGWADPVKITASGGARKGGFKKSRPLFLLCFENQIYWQIAFLSPKKKMTEKTLTENPVERRSEIRENLEKMQSLELKLPNLPIYVFKVKDTSPNGICLLVKENSDMLNHIRVGQILNLKCYSEDKSEPSEIFISEIKHITKEDKHPYQSHHLVGSMVLEKRNQSRSTI